MDVRLRNGNIGRDASGCVLAPDERVALRARLGTGFEVPAAFRARNERLDYVVGIFGVILRITLFFRKLALQCGHSRALGIVSLWHCMHSARRMEGRQPIIILNLNQSMRNVSISNGSAVPLILMSSAKRSTFLNQARCDGARVGSPA